MLIHTSVWLYKSSFGFEAVKISTKKLIVLQVLSFGILFPWISTPAHHYLKLSFLRLLFKISLSYAILCCVVYYYFDYFFCFIVLLLW